MAKGCCSGDTCSCLIRSGNGITVSGSGSAIDPYIVTADLPDFSRSLTVRDTESVNMTILGSGVPSDPFILQATSILKLQELADVDDPQGGPAIGDVPVWVGSGDDGHFEFRTPPTAPAGAVNATNGIIGIGSVADPLEVSVSGTWGVAPLNTYGTDSTVGLAIYIDSSGQLRARPPGSTTVAWASVTGKPTTFAPSAHTHTASQITDQQNIDAGKIGGKTIFSQQAQPSSTGRVAGDLWFRW